MKKFYLIACTILSAGIAHAQMALTAIGTPVTIDFTGFAGAGFQPGGGGGTLNSDFWSATGFSDGDVAFGATAATGDFARGSTMGLVTTGGIYAVDIAGNQGLMVQPVADDFTPGSFILKLVNSTGNTIGSIDLAYTIYVLNDQMRSNSFNFSYSFDDLTYFNVPTLDYASVEAADLTPYITNESTSLTGLSIAPGDVFYFRWTGDDVSGTMSRDEFALDDISITPQVATPTPIVSFNTATVDVDESSPTAGFILQVSETTDCTVHLSVAAGGTATEGADYTYAIPDPLIFLTGEATSAFLNIGIINDLLDEPDETVTIQIDDASGTCVLGPPSSVTVTIHDDDATVPPVYTEYDIAEVTGEDVDGNANSIGELVDLTGIVYGVNIWDGGLQFTLIDNTGGISVFNFDHNFGYTVAEGDQVNILGTIDQFNGLTEVIADTLIYIDGGNTLKTPTFATTLGEPTESDFITMDLAGYYFTDVSQWLGDGTSYNVDLSNGANNVQLRIDNNTELASMPFGSIFPAFVMSGQAAGELNVTGLGGQYDASSPYTDGYQIFPRYTTDLFGVWESIQSFEDAGFSLYPNPATDVLNISGDKNIESIEVLDQTGRVVDQISVNDFSNALNITNIPAGVYLLKLISENNIYATSFIKQ